MHDALRMAGIDGVHRLESELSKPASDVEYPSLLQRRRLLPRVDNGEPLSFGWRLKRTRDFHPVAALFPYGLAVAGGYLVASDDPDGEPLRDEPFPFMDDVVRQVDGLTKYTLRLWYGPHLNSWDVVDGELRTSFDLVPRGGPFVVRQKKSGDFAISCSQCGWRGSGERSATVMLQRLVGDVARHDCPVTHA